jgi:TonB-linked SusC/RagA family outer membrane protein
MKINTFKPGMLSRLPKKLLLIMKITTFILMIALAQVSAKSFGQRITLNEHNTPLEAVLKSIKLQSGYDFFYNSRDLKGQKVTVKLTNATVDDAIKAAISGLPLSYKIVKKNIVLTRNESISVADKNANTNHIYSDTIHVKGIVTDSLGNLLEGATLVLVQNSPIERYSEHSSIYVLGKTASFDIVAYPGDNIVVSFIGFANSAILVTKDNPFQRIILSKVASNLREVVVSTGFQTRIKERATGSFGKADMQVFSKRTGTTDVIARLEGQIPGLQIAVGSNNQYVNQDAQNGNSSTKSTIRGTSTVLHQNPPLYVVNGIIVPDFSSINQDDIEDITVLKDAAASAIWGAQSANGVIVIKTKSGSKNQRLAINYNGFVNYAGRPQLFNKNLLNSQQYIQLAKQLFDPVNYPWESLGFVAPHDQILYDQYRHLITTDVANRKLDSLASINNNSQIRSLLFQPAFTTNHTLSASGGNNVYSFYGSLGYTGTQPNDLGSKNKAYKVNLTQSISPSDRVKISLNTSFVNTVANTGNPIPVSGAFLPYQLFRDAAGNNVKMNYMNGYIDSLTNDYQARSRVNLDYTPLDEVNLKQISQNNINLNATANVAVKIWKGLSFSGTYGYVSTRGTQTSYEDHGTIDQRRLLVSLTEAPTVNSTPIYDYPTTGGAYSTASSEQRNWTVRNQLVYDAALRNNKDHLLLQAGQDLTESYAYNAQTNVLGYNDALGSYATLDFEKLRNGIFPTVSGFGFYSYNPFTIQKVLSRFKSYFGLASYTLNNKYSLDASWRQDYSNQFASEISTQNKPIWSMGGKWRISQERFLQPVKWLNDLGLRVTYGITGNSPYGSVSQYDVLNAQAAATTYNYNLIAGNAYTIGSVGTKTLAWENTNNLNIGLDFAVLNSRISGSIDAYRRVTTDMIGRVDLNPLSGYTSQTGNLGKMTNNGIELSLRTENIRTKDFNWSTSVSFGYNKNKMISYSTPNSNYYLVPVRLSGAVPVPGYSLSQLWAYNFVGLDNLGDPLIRLANGTVTKNPNAATVNDLVYMGSTVPISTGGFSNVFSYKGVSLSANMIYNLGAVMRRPVNGFYSGQMDSSPSFGGGNIDADFLNRWQKPGDEAHTNIPSYVASQSDNFRRNTGYYTSGNINVVSASYIKLRDVTLAYDLKPQLLDALHIKKASVFVQGTNFLVWAANHYGIDPELPSQLSGSPLTTHSYSLGINVSL